MSSKNAGCKDKLLNKHTKETINLTSMDANITEEIQYCNRGKIQFSGNEDSEKCPEFIRYEVGNKTDGNKTDEDLDRMVENAFVEIENLYRDNKPYILISVIGGFKRMDITKRQKKIFKQGLIDIMKNNRTIIITGGFNVGVHKLASESVSDFRNLSKCDKNDVILIGICTLGVIFNNENLMKKNEVAENVYKYSDSESNIPKKVALDPNCNLYFFCDDGTEKQYDKEVEFRSKFECYAKSEKKLHTVQILFEGGYRAILMSERTVKNNIPIVVINHSGRAANLISKVWEAKDDKENTFSIVKKYKILLNIEEIMEITNCLDDMYKNYKEKILIHDMDDYSTELDNSILEAVIKDRAGIDPIEIIYLSIRFNCIEIAEEQLKSEYSTISDNDISKLIEENFIEIITKNKHEFVKFFLEKDYQFEKNLTEEMLKDLYKESTGMDNLRKVGKTISELSNYILSNIYPKKSVYGFQDLFLWTLLVGQIEMAKIFWENGKEHVSSALIGSIILKEKASEANLKGDSELQKKLIDDSLFFETMALTVLTKAVHLNHEQTIFILKKELKTWNKTSCLDIALNGKLLNFLDHSACTSYTASVWMGGLSPLLKTWRVLLNIPFGICLGKRLIGPFFGDNVTDSCNGSPLNTEECNVGRQSHCSNRKEQDLKFWQALRKFYAAPIVKFYVNFISYIAFLFVFAYLNLVELKPRKKIEKFSDLPAEIYIYTYILSFSLEEIRQIYDQNCTGFCHKMKSYLSGSCNQQDLIIIIVFLSSVVVRFLLSEDYFMICRCFFAICYCMFCLRTLQFYFAYEFIGPKVVMIGEMIRDIGFFLSIFTLVIISFGTLSQSMRSPNSVLNITLIDNIFKLPYFQTYGEVMLEKVIDESPCETINCFVQYTTIILGLAIYLLMTNILLVNLLIAMFGYTFNTIHNDSKKHWSFIRLQLVKEFYKKPMLPPPFNLLSYVYRLFINLIKKENIGENDSNPFLKKLKKEQDLKITNFEKLCADKVLDEYLMKGDIQNHETTELSDKLLGKKDLEKEIRCFKEISDFRFATEKRLDNIDEMLKSVLIRFRSFKNY